MGYRIQCPKCGSSEVTTQARPINREGARVNNSLGALVVGGTLYVITSVGAGAFVTFVVAVLLLTRINGLGTIDGDAATGLAAVTFAGGILFSALLFWKGDQRWRAVATVYNHSCAGCHHRWEVVKGRSAAGIDANEANANRH